MSEGQPHRLELRGVAKSFGAVRAVDDVSLHIAPGEIRGLCGHNGAGKSTVINMLTGLVTPDAGEIRVDGAVLELPTPRAAQRAGVAWVNQELSLVPALSIAENIGLGSVEAGFVRRRGGERVATRALLARVGLEDHDPGAPVAGLSLGTRQLLEIARALGRGARTLILDEPTATLTDVEIERVFAAVRRVAAEGCAVIFVSHRLGEVLELCDVVTVMRDGRVVEERAVGDLTAETLVQAMLGEQLDLAPHDRAREDGATLLGVRDLAAGARLRGFSHDFAAGHVYGLAGQVGAGTSEVLRALAGLLPGATGTAELDGTPLSLRHPVRNARQGVGFVTNDRKGEGLFLGRTVAENLTATRLRAVAGRGGVLSPRRERAHAQRLAEEAGVAADRLDAPVGVLSGGNQQKALVGRYLVRDDVRVLLVDEPTRGVDIGGRAAIHGLLRASAEEGKTVIFASSDLDELLELAMTVITMRAGRIVGVYPEGVTRQAMLSDLTHREEATR
jgi:ABC-type sugar transport system ATPase subunit